MRGSKGGRLWLDKIKSLIIKDINYDTAEVMKMY